jgi:hypothetical protein
LTSAIPSSIDKDIKKESLWDKAIDAEQRIKQIGETIEPEFYEVITDRQKASQILVDLAKSVKSEELILLPNDKSMVRLNRLGVFDYAIKASQENAAEVKIICPLSQVNSHIVKKISDHAPNIKATTPHPAAQTTLDLNGIQASTSKHKTTNKQLFLFF